MIQSSNDYTNGAKSFIDHLWKNRRVSTIIYFLFIPFTILLAHIDFDKDSPRPDYTMWWVVGVTIVWNIAIKIKQYHKYKQLKRGISS